jgi:hypothetical protein
MRSILVLSAIVFLAACGHSATGPTGPTAPTATAVTFGLAGGVSDIAGHPLAQARVEVLDGPQKGTVVMTDDAGAFAFGKIFASPFILRASKEGHRDQSREISTAQSDGFFKLELDLGGSYTITFAADAACTGLPAAARTRTYSVSFASNGSSFYLGTLGGADFARGSTPSYSAYNVLYATLIADVGHIFFSDPEIWEHLARETDLSSQADLVILGDATGAVRPETSQWLFAGTFAYCPEPEPEDYPDCKVPVIRCQSQSHQLTLTRTR